MSTQPLNIDQWPTTGVDLETRRRRILAALAAMSRTDEQQQFRRRLRALTEGALRTGDYGPLERYVHGWYLHTIRLATDPAWAAEWDQLRRHPPPPPDPEAARPLEEVIARGGAPQ
jgi:hypothetical protein